MITDTRTIPSGATLQADVAIVGGGAAGITLAREFIGHRHKVCLLESGGIEFDSKTQSLCMGENIGLPYFPLDTCRLRFMGGTTNHWSRTCRPLDEIDFEEREWVPHSGWPFRKKDLDPYYERAHPIFGMPRTSVYDPQKWSTRVPMFVFPGGRVKTTLFQVSRTSSFSEAYRRELAAAGNIQVLLFANVTEILTDAYARTVAGLSAATLDGKRLTISARMFVLAAGGIENARLLLISNKVQKEGLGNKNDVVGRFFMDHPHMQIGVLLPQQLYGPFAMDTDHETPEARMVSSALALSEEVQREEKLLNHCTLVRQEASDSDDLAEGVASAKQLARALAKRTVPADFATHLKNVIADIDVVTATIYRRWKADARLFVLARLMSHSESAPNPDSRVTLSSDRDALGLNRCRLDWRLSELDKRSMRRALEVMAREVGRLGLGRIRVLLDADDSWPLPSATLPWTGPDGAYHHIGTTRMHVDPRRGVVDQNCKVHGISNLFIAGSSVFPTSGFANPTLTIVALTIRLADFIKASVPN